MPSESSLSSAERESLIINRFIFHVIMRDKDEPSFFSEVTLENNEKDFFQKRIAESAEGTQFIFVDDKSADTKVKDTAEELLADDSGFIGKSKELAIKFLKYHKTVNSKDGVFVVAMVSIAKAGGTVNLLSMIKMDHTRVLQFETEDTEHGRKAIIKEIANTFVEDKKAVQKMALVDASDTFSWNVLGSERRSKDDLADFFKHFLGVSVREVPSILTKRAVQTVRGWAGALTVMPEGENVATYKSRAINYMQNQDTFEIDSFLDFVVKDLVDLGRKADMMEALRDALSESGVAGQNFQPMPDSLTAATKRSTAKTNKEVQIIWSGDPHDRGVDIPVDPDDDGKYCIRIYADEKPTIE